MESIYLVCAAVGGVLLALQILFQLVGHADVDHDFDADVQHDGTAGDDFVRLLSIKTLVCGLAFFGLSGLAARQFGLTHLPSLGIAVTAGLTAIYLLAKLMAMLARLQSRGNVDLANACGLEARCYLRIPARARGTGRIHVTLQGRVVECRAVTSGDAIPTGAPVRVVGLRDGATLEVAPSAR